MKRVYTYLAALAATGLLILAGCIVTGTFVITAKIVPDENGKNFHLTNLVYDGGEVVVDLSDDKDFKENKDKIENIDNIGFYLSIKNNHLTDAVDFQLFLEKDTSANYTTNQLVIDNATELIFTGLSVPANTKKVITWNESMKFIEGIENIKAILKSGTFSIYPVINPTPTDYDVTVDSLVVIVTLTGG